MYTYAVTVEVGVRELRENLSHWLGRAAGGEDVVVTERGRPSVRLSAAAGYDELAGLIASGRARAARRPKQPIDVAALPRLHGEGPSLAEMVIEQRRGTGP